MAGIFPEPGAIETDEARPEEASLPPLACLVCRGGKFHRRAALLNTAGATFLGVEWANREATCLVCAKCGFVHWFLVPPK